jgi:UDP-N-acetylglucosamine--N-acetylmuramyl-(pentapeptide) pyrophosphoryl-undecaprenol N-acetylglucosamine transferase
LIKLVKSSSQAKKIIKDFSPDAVLGFGGYVSGPVLRAACKLGVPTAIHEQNAFPGVTNKTLAKIVDKVMLTAAEAEKYMQPKNPCVVTGLPIRGEMINADRDFARAELGVDDRPVILSMGGSLGARVINEAVTQHIEERYQLGDRYFLHATGKAGVGMFDVIKNEKKIDLDKNKHIMLREYINDMHRCMAAADLVICRAGAMTLSELAIRGRASILIPSPNVTEDHQYKNARLLADAGAAIVCRESETDGKLIAKYAKELLSNKNKRVRMEESIKAFAMPNSIELIVDNALSLLK